MLGLITMIIGADSLAAAGRFLLSSERGSRNVEIHLETDYCKLTANKTVDDCIDVRLVQPSCDVSRSGLAGVATATQICRAVRSVQSGTRAGISDKQGKWDFPSEHMDMLAEELGAAAEKGLRSRH